MPTIAQQLTELVNQKKTLAANLTTKGVASTEDEKLNTLVPKVLQITTGSGLDTSDATATKDDILYGKTAYVAGEKIEGTILSEEEQIIMPSTIDKTISKGIYIAGTQTIKGDENLQSGNIKKGVTIFNVLGTLEEGIDTSDADATAADIASGKTAYVNGEKLTGTHTELDTSTATATEADILEGKTAFVNGEEIEGIIPLCTTDTITPSTIDQTLSGCYIDGTLTVSGDADLAAENIRTGVSIFGVDGIFTSDADAIASDILSGKIAYVNGEKITGTYVDSGAAETFTPSNPYIPTTEDLTIATSSKLVSSDIIISGDENLLAENIKTGISIFGVEGTYEGGGGSVVKEGVLLDTSSFTTSDETLNTYGDSIYILETRADNSTFSSLSTMYTDRGGADTVSSNKNYIASSSNKYGIIMGNWGGSKGTDNEILFTTPLELNSGRFLILLNCLLSSWMTQSLNIHLVSATGDTQAEILSALETKIAAQEYDYTISYSYSGSMSGTDMITYAKDIKSGTYYLHITGTKTQNNDNFTYVVIKYINLE